MVYVLRNIWFEYVVVFLWFLLLEVGNMSEETLTDQEVAIINVALNSRNVEDFTNSIMSIEKVKTALNILIAKVSAC